MIIVVDNLNGTYTCEVPNSKYEYNIVGDEYIQENGVVEVNGADVLVSVMLEDEICHCDNLLYNGILSTKVRWNICGDTETLCISGSGSMPLTITGEWRDHYGTFNHIIIGNSVKMIGNNAFQNCTNLEDVIIGNSVTSIGTNTFQNCTNLKNVIIGNSVKIIDNNAFYGCSQLKEIIIPDLVTSINFNVFVDCTGLEEIIIPFSVISIGERAFSGCTSLIKLINHALIPQTINANVFQNVNKTTCIIEVPSTSLLLYQNADVWKDFQNIIGI